MNRPSWGIAILIAVVCFFVGGFGGCLIGVGMSELGQEFLREAGQVEEDADVSSPSLFENSSLSFQYPGNWTEDLDSYYDGEHRLSFDTPGGSYIEVTIDQFSSDVDKIIADKRHEHEDLLINPEVSYFVSYGSFSGKGVKVSDSLMGLGETYRVFCYSEGEQTVVITEYWWEMDREMIEPGFDLIERTLKLR